jgi:acyl-CoA thioesterase FadM
VTASSARFLAPARYGDSLDIQVTVGTCSERSVRFDFQIGRRPGGEPVATGEITCVAIDAGWRSIALPQEWRERLVGSPSPPRNRP